MSTNSYVELRRLLPSALSKTANVGDSAFIIHNTNNTTMRFASIAALLLLSAAAVDAQAAAGDCKDFNIATSNDCKNECMSRAAGKKRSWSIRTGLASGGVLTKCECTYSTGFDPEDDGLPAEGTFICTNERTPQPQPPVITEEDCPDSIKTGQQCTAFCKSLSGNFRVSSSNKGGGDITNCTCEYGPGRQNLYRCTRAAGYLRSS